MKYDDDIDVNKYYKIVQDEEFGLIIKKKTPLQCAEDEQYEKQLLQSITKEYERVPKICFKCKFCNVRTWSDEEYADDDFVVKYDCIKHHHEIVNGKDSCKDWEWENTQSFKRCQAMNK